MFERTLVVGDSGSGKTTVGEALATGLGVEHIDLDALFWTEPAWQTPPPEAFRARVAEALGRSERWVLSGNYSVVQDLTWASADTACGSTCRCT